MQDEKRQEIVVITGASAGLGRATAREFACKGADLGLIARGTERLEATKREVEAFGGRAVIVRADVADAAAVEAAAERIEEELGPIDIWVNSAMTTVFSPFQDIAPEDYKRVTEVTYLGQVHGTMAALKRMRPRNRGVIVNVGSALAYRSIPLQAAYCGAKHAVKGFTEAVRTELIHEGSDIHVTLVQMPALNTPQFDWCRNHMPGQARPVAPVYEPGVGADAVYWAAHNRRREVFVGLSSVLTVWGNKLMPQLMDQYVARTTVSGQQDEQPSDPDQPDNLWQPVEGEQGAHGRFGDEAHGSSLQLWATTRRARIGLAAGAALLGAAVCSLSRRRQARIGMGRSG